MADTEEKYVPWAYTPRTDDEMKQLAVDIMAGRMFGTWDLENPEDARRVFMPLGLSEPKHLQEMAEANVAHFYEYLEKAGPRSCNGFPMFMSMKVLDGNDATKLHTIINKLQAAQDEALASVEAGQ